MRVQIPYLDLDLNVRTVYVQKEDEKQISDLIESFGGEVLTENTQKLFALLFCRDCGNPHPACVELAEGGYLCETCARKEGAV